MWSVIRRLEQGDGNFVSQGYAEKELDACAHKRDQQRGADRFSSLRSLFVVVIGSCQRRGGPQVEHGPGKCGADGQQCQHPVDIGCVVLRVQRDQQEAQDSLEYGSQAVNRGVEPRFLDLIEKRFFCVTFQCSVLQRVSAMEQRE